MKPIIQATRTVTRLRNMFSLIFVCMATCCLAQNVPNENTMAPEKLQQDFQLLRSALEEGYPGLNTYHSKTFTDSLFNTSKQQLQKAFTEREFYVFLSKVVMQLHDGHMDVYPTTNTTEKLRNKPCSIPFQAFISKDKMYVQKNYSTLSDKELLGAEIISINGHPVSAFIAEVLKICTSDGNNLTNKFKRLESTGLLTQYLFYLQGYTENYTIQYIPLNGSKTKTTTIPGIGYENLLEIRKSRYPGIEQSPAEFKLIGPATAYLKIKSFNRADYTNSHMDYKALLQSSFTTIQANGIQNLILDLRGNGGGTDAYGKILFSYFIDHPFTYYQSLIINKPHFNFTKYTDDPDLEIPEDAIKINQNGTYDVIDHPNVGIQEKSTPYYSGKLFVLIDGDCFSTTSECLSMLNSYTAAVFIGEESGGGYYGNCSGSVPLLTLPHSSLQIGIPLMKYSMAVTDYPYKDRGLIPNYTIAPTIKDKILAHDPELEWAKKLINDAARPK